MKNAREPGLVVLIGTLLACLALVILLPTHLSRIGRISCLRTGGTPSDQTSSRGLVALSTDAAPPE